MAEAKSGGSGDNACTIAAAILAVLVVALIVGKCTVEVRPVEVRESGRYERPVLRAEPPCEPIRLKRHNPDGTAIWSVGDC
ncbi:hypothetical protein HY970_00675 [Candidatus Kaiserbacteria bacterium]|nr:hypothetical protein [Candidatus Kaiserbacteria bacterium]